MNLQELEIEIKKLIVETLMLEDVEPTDIVSGEPLFNEGLGLDSIDALELAMAIDQRWGISFGADDESNREIFQSVFSLAQYISSQVSDR